MTYEEAIIGQEIDYREFQITSEMQRNYLEALQDESPFYLEGDPSTRPIAHPLLILNYAFPAEWMGSPGEHIHAKNDIQFFNPTRVGKKMIARSKVYDKYIRRGKKYVTTEITCIGEDGVEVMRCRWTEIYVAVGE